jgi:hypothetical protein
MYLGAHLARRARGERDAVAPQVGLVEVAALRGESCDRRSRPLLEQDRELMESDHAA